jgi:hypothetical protein
MKIAFGEYDSQFGSGVSVTLNGNELATAVMNYLEAECGLGLSGPRTVKVNGELCDVARVFVDPLGSVTEASGKVWSGRGPQYIGASADSPLRGDDAKWNLATVKEDCPDSGLTKNAHVAIMVKYRDDLCIVDPGDDKAMVIVHLSTFLN